MKFILNLSPLYRFLIGILVAAIVYFVLRSENLNILFDISFSWIGFTTTYLLLSWAIILKRKSSEIRIKAREDDGSVAFVFSLIFLASLASFFVVLFLTTSEDTALKNSKLLIPTAVSTMILSWFVVHTQYIFHYAHEYYDEDDNGDEEQIGGLKFPDDEDPDYLDFAYYSLCMGCTFQVSDVSTTSKHLRRITMIHGLLSFFINTFLVALTINLVAGMNG